MATFDITGRFDDTEVIRGVQRVTGALEQLDETNKELWANYSKEMKEAAKDSEAFNDQLGKMGNEAKETKKQFEANEEALKQNRSQLVETIKQYKVFGISLNDIEEKLNLIKGGFGGAAKGAKGFVGTLRLIKRAVIATGLGALLIVLTSLVTFFTKTRAGGEKLRVMFKQLGAVVNVVVDRLGKLGAAIVESGRQFIKYLNPIRLVKDLFNGEFKRSIEGIREVFKGMGDEIEREIRLARQLEEQLIRIEKAELLLSAQRAKSRALIKELNKIGEDTTKTYKQREEAIRSALAIENQLLQDQIELQELRIRNFLADNFVYNKFGRIQQVIAEGFTSIEDAAQKANAIIGEIGLSESSQTDLEELITLFTNYYGLQEQSDELQTTLQNKLNTLLREQQAKREAITKELESQVQTLTDKYLTAQLASLEGAEQLFRAYELGKEELVKMQKELEEIFKLAGKPFPESLKTQFDDLFGFLKADFEKQLTELRGTKDLEKLLLPIDENKPRKIILEQVYPLRDEINLFLSELFGGASLEELDKIREGILTTFDVIASEMTRVLETQIENQDILLDELNEKIGKQQEIVDEQIRLNEDGFASQLDQEREYLEELEAQREAAEQKKIALIKKAAKQQLAIDLATQISSLSTAAADYFSAHAKIPFVGIALALGAIATMYATFRKAKAQAKAAAASIPKLRKGAKLEGKSHEAGGTPLQVIGGQLYEAEKDEWLIGTQPSREHDKFLHRLNEGEYQGLDLAAIVSKHESPIGVTARKAKATQERKSSLIEAKKWSILADAYYQASGRIVEAIEEQPNLLFKDGKVTQIRKKGKTVVKRVI